MGLAIAAVKQEKTLTNNTSNTVLSNGVKFELFIENHFD